MIEKNSHQLSIDSERVGTEKKCVLFANQHSESLDNAIRLARRIPLGREHTPEKCEAVHAWVKAVKDMLKGNV